MAVFIMIYNMENCCIALFLFMNHVTNRLWLIRITSRALLLGIKVAAGRVFHRHSMLSSRNHMY